MDAKKPELGVPGKLLKEFTDRKITVETNTGVTFRGILDEIEDNMNMTLSSVKAVQVDGFKTEMISVYIKGSRIRLVNLPDSAKDALAILNKPAFRGGRGGSRGGRGGFRGGRGGFGGSRGGSKPSYGSSSYGSSSYDRRY